MAGKIIADTIEASGSQISLNVGNVTILTASSTGLTLIPTTNVNVNLTNSIVTLTNGSATSPGLTFSGNTRTGLFMPSANTLAFTAANTESMRIDSSGNVGIGTNSPAVKLDVRGTSTYLINATNPTAWVSADSALTTGSIYSQWNTSTNEGIFGSYTNHPIYFVTNNSRRLTIDTSGNVGIGTSSPASKLDIPDVSANGLRLSGSGDHALGFVGYSGNAATQVFSIRNDGISNLYINTQNSVPLNFGVSTGTTFGTIISQMKIISTGQVGINATPASGNTFRVINIGSDNACQFGNASNGVYLPYASPTAWSSYSDARLKDVIGNYENALDHILQLNPVKYTWKSDANKKVNIGLLAQNVLEVIPEIVDENTLPNDEEDKTEYLSLRYTDLIPVLIGSIQELKAIVDAQAVEIAALKAK